MILDKCAAIIDLEGKLLSENFRDISYNVEDRVARITINRPPLNVLSVNTIGEIIAALKIANVDKNVIVVIIAGGGERAFSAGVDIGAHLPKKIDKTLDEFHKMFQLLTDLEKPTIAVVNGLAFGGGCELAMACDMVVASENAQFGQPEIKVGAIATVAAALLPKLVGRKHALELIFTGEIITATEAKQIGLVNSVVPAERLVEAVNDLVLKLKNLSPVVLKMVKKAVYQGIDSDFREALAGVTDVYLKQLIHTEDAVEGLKAFLEKRKPEWRGK